MTENTKTKSAAANSIRAIVTDGLFIAFVLVATMFINLRLPIAANGGLIHLGNVPLIFASVIFGKKTGAIAGAFGMGLFALLSGWTLWAPFTFVIVGIMGYVMGCIAERREGNSFLFNTLAVLAATAIKVVGYYIAEIILYGNWASPLLSVPGNLVQMGLAAVIALPLISGLKQITKRRQNV